MMDSTQFMSSSTVEKLLAARIAAIRSIMYAPTLTYASCSTTLVSLMIFIKLDLAGRLLVPSGKLRLSGIGDNGYFSASLKPMT